MTIGWAITCIVAALFVGATIGVLLICAVNCGAADDESTKRLMLRIAVSKMLTATDKLDLGQPDGLLTEARGFAREVLEQWAG